MPARELPKILTLKDWNAKKGVIAKATTETGIGAALTKLKTEWDKVPWDILDPDAAMSAAGKGRQTVALLDQCLEVAKKNMGKLEPLRRELIAVETLTAKIEKDWKTKKLIPASSRKHVGDMKVAAERFKVAMKSVDNDWLHRRKKLEEDEERLKGIARAQLKGQIDTLKKYAREVEKNPTVANFVGEAKTGFYQSVRGLNASLARLKDPAITDWKDRNWNPMASAAFVPKKDSEVAGKVTTVLDKLAELERMLA